MGYYNSMEGRMAGEKNVKHILNLYRNLNFECFSSNGKVLDLGCSKGWFINACNKSGYNK